MKSKCEKMVSDQLRGKGYEEFLPMCWSRRLWSDRVKVIQMPLFTGYLFCRFDPENRFAILTTPGVCTIVGRGRTPLPVDANQVESIRLAVRSGQGVEPWPRLEVGNKVRIEVGPLSGVEGTLLRHKGTTHLILGVTLMQRAVAVEIDETWVMPSPNIYNAPKSTQQSAQPQLVS